MTIREIAKELIDKMRDEIPCHCDDWEQAKQCALIAIDELIYYGEDINMIIYFKEIKQEIENYERI